MMIKSPFKNHNHESFKPLVPDEVLYGQQAEQFESVETTDNDLISFAEILNRFKVPFIYNNNQFELFENLKQFFKTNQMKHVFVWENELAEWLSSFGPSEVKYERTLNSSNVAISFCESIAADEGSILLNPIQHRFRPLDVFPKYHIIIVSRHQIKPNIKSAVLDFCHRSDNFPFLINFNEERRDKRFVENKVLIESLGTKNIIVFYSEDAILV